MQVKYRSFEIVSFVISLHVVTELFIIRAKYFPFSQLHIV